MVFGLVALRRIMTVNPLNFDSQEAVLLFAQYCFICLSRATERYYIFVNQAFPFSSVMYAHG